MASTQMHAGDQHELLPLLGSRKIHDNQAVSETDLQRPSKRRRRPRVSSNINSSLEKHVSNQAYKSDQAGPDCECRSQLATTYLVNNNNNCSHASFFNVDWFDTRRLQYVPPPSATANYYLRNPPDQGSHSCDIVYETSFTQQEWTVCDNRFIPVHPPTQDRQQHVASARSLMDRRKFIREFVHSEIGLLSEYEWVYRTNPHLIQVFLQRSPFVVASPISSSNRLLTDQSPHTHYESRRGQIKTVEHWGQRKLILSEIEFLTAHASHDDIVLYIGAAPGLHINYLASVLFPNLRWMLIDPSGFAATATDNIYIERCFFTDVLAQSIASVFRDPFSTSNAISEAQMATVEFPEYIAANRIVTVLRKWICKNIMRDQGRVVRNGVDTDSVNTEYVANLILISDIRSFDDDMSDQLKEERVSIDMNYQRSWVSEILRPKACMLKFRLPFRSGATCYLNGDLHFQVWAGRTSTETRLVIDALQHGFRSKIYDHDHYNNAVFHFNLITRTTFYPHSIIGIGLDHCYDCSTEIYILQHFLEMRLRDTNYLTRTVDLLIGDDGSAKAAHGYDIGNIQSCCASSVAIADLSKDISSNICGSDGRSLDIDV